MQCKPFALPSPVDCNDSSKLVASKMACPTVRKAATAAKAATATKSTIPKKRHANHPPTPPSSDKEGAGKAKAHSSKKDDSEKDDSDNSIASECHSSSPESMPYDDVVYVSKKNDSEVEIVNIPAAKFCQRQAKQSSRELCAETKACTNDVPGSAHAWDDPKPYSLGSTAKPRQRENCKASSTVETCASKKPPAK